MLISMDPEPDEYVFAIREATIEDAQAIATVNYLTWLHAYRGLIPDSDLDSLDIEALTDRWQQSLNAGTPRSKTFVVTNSDSVIAYSRLYPSVDPDDDQARVATIGSMYVIPEFHRKGVGRQLMETVLQAARDHDFAEATLHVLAANRPARNFYEDMGWTEDLNPVIERSGEETAPKARYRKNLGSKDSVGVATYRSQLGRAIADWVSSPKMVWEVSPSSWYLFTGLPSANANIALVHQNDAQVLNELTEQVERMGVPASVFLAGDARALSVEIGEGWRFVGTTPFMSLDLKTAELKEDPLVRLASKDDFETVVTLMSETFEMNYDSAAQGASVLNNPNARCDVWILEDGGQLVSTAITRRVDDVITLWNMATSPRFARRGYGRAIMNHALFRANQDGAKVGLLIASDAGKLLYDATGWVTIEDWDVYLGVPAVN